MQLGFATVVAMAYLVVQSQAAPYRSPGGQCACTGLQLLALHPLELLRLLQV